jgi:hypothetical protein
VNLTGIETLLTDLPCISQVPFPCHYSGVASLCDMHVRVVGWSYTHPAHLFECLRKQRILVRENSNASFASIARPARPLEPRVWSVPARQHRASARSTPIPAEPNEKTSKSTHLTAAYDCVHLGEY